MIEVTPLAPDHEAAWDDFLIRTPGGLLYHSIAYRNLLAGLLGCEAEYLVARDGGEVRGVLPVMWSAGDGGRVCNSLPFYGSHGAPVTSDGDAERALIGAWDERATDSGTLAATMVANPFLDHEQAEPVHGLGDERISQVTPLPPEPDEEALMAAFSKNGRRDVRRAERRGVEVGRDESRLSDLWRLHDENIRAVGGLPKAEAFFDAVPKHFDPGEGYDLWVASKDGEMVAGLLVFYFAGVAEYWTPAVDARYRADEPMALILFHAMLQSVRRGCRLWNWGGTWSSQDGVYSFKRKWGAEESRYEYFVQVNDSSLLDATADELRSRFPYFYVAPFSALRQGVTP